jgi:hypothetical protein
MLRALFLAMILAGALAGSALTQAPDAGCALPSESKDIPAAIDAAITGPPDKDRACMKVLLIPEARMLFVSIGADRTPSYTIQTLDDWITRVKARGHALLEEKQLKFHIERYGNIAHSWSSYALHQRRQASRTRHQQHSSDQGSRRLASYGHHGAGGVGRCAAAYGISAVREASLRMPSRLRGDQYDEPTPVKVMDLKEAT